MADNASSVDTDSSGQSDRPPMGNCARDSSLDENACGESLRCVRCYNFANLMCERCGDRYCSSVCQAKDWLIHKKICFPLLFTHQFSPVGKQRPSSGQDELDTATCSVDEWMKREELLFLTPRELRAKSIPTNTNVQITSIVNHKTVFVRPTFPSADEYMCELFDDIEHYGHRDFRSLKKLPKCGGIYLADFEMEFYRVYVLAAASRNYKIDVFFIDFGNTDSVWLNQLSELSDDLKRRPILLNKIYLASVSEIAFSDNPMRFMNQLCEDEVELTMIIDGESAAQDHGEGECRMMPKFCHLQFENDELTVNRKLNRLNSNVFSLDPDKCMNHLFTKSLPIFIYDITYLWSDDYNVEMQILQNSKIDSFGYLTCVRRDNRVTFDRNMAEIAEYGRNIKLIKMYNGRRPRLHEVCIIENIERKKWHRAFCADPDIHKINCTALMVLLDLDDVLEIPYIRIWKLPPALAFPVLTIDCFIQEINPHRYLKDDHLSLQHELRINRCITFDSMARIPNSVKNATVSCKWIQQLIASTKSLKL